jgi:hypothetical protein
MACLHRIFESPLKLLHISFGNPEIFRLELECCLKMKTGIGKSSLEPVSRYCFFIWFLQLIQKDKTLSTSPDSESAFTEIDLDTTPAFPYPILDNRPVFPS